MNNLHHIQTKIFSGMSDKKIKKFSLELCIIIVIYFASLFLGVFAFLTI